jgi:hypothetical protein
VAGFRKDINQKNPVGLDMTRLYMLGPGSDRYGMDFYLDTTQKKSNCIFILPGFYSRSVGARCVVGGPFD